MSDIEDREGCGSDTNDLHQDRPTQSTLMDGNSIRQTRTKTYTSGAHGGRFKGNRELSEDEEVMQPKTYKMILLISPIVVDTNRPMRCEDDPAAASLTLGLGLGLGLTETIGYLDREMGSN